ncbi:MAG: hypothetical protein V1811_02075 [Candidatus Micrarchaeota archaeon]
MGAAYDFFKGIINSIPVLIRKTGTVVLFFGFIGMLLGYYIATANLSLLFMALPVLVMAIMWNDLDHGILALIAYFVLLFFYPSLLF